MDQGDFIAIVGMTAMTSLLVLLASWITWVVGRRSQERIRGHLELQRLVLDKFGSAAEFVSFLGSDAGRRFLESFSTEHSVHTREILGSLRKGAVLSLVGAGLCVVPVFERNLRPLSFFGVVALATGIGFLVSAWASYRLSRSWGLLPPAA